MHGMGHIPVKRGTMDAVQSLTAAVDALDAGRVIVLHPEGTVTRDPDGWPMAGKTGAARLAMLARDVPVIPVVQWGVQDSVDLYRKRVRLIPAARGTRCRSATRSTCRPSAMPRSPARRCARSPTC